MKTLSSVILIALLIFLMALPSFALKIIYPSEGEEFYAGTKFTVIVQPEPGETWNQVLLGIFPMSYDSSTNEYREDVRIPPDASGDLGIDVLAADNLGNEVKLHRGIFVKLPLSAVLQGIKVGEDLKVLYIAPSGSSPEDKQMIETDQVSVAGVYSDGVNRLITSSALGTTYASSDEKIVTVDSEGKLTAKGLGQATITVKNGKYSATVKIVVKPYDQ